MIGNQKNTLHTIERMVTDDDHPWDHIPFDDITNALDAWILLKLQQTIKTVNE
ncbi:MAG: hypothetical protein KatS3mg035_2200 [Bacteroidia bacterium]|nr:MAG: hypothetical protein KatS3mg035_2200 [Bacteroidia bacterium]